MIVKVGVLYSSAILMVAFCSLADAQVLPPPGPTDTNPYNVANWENIASTGSHTATGTSWYKDATGVHSSVVETVYVPQPSSPSIVSVPSNSSEANHSAKMEISASVKLRKHWIGVGAAPTKLWILKSATATGKVQPNGTVTLSNGLGSPTTFVDGPEKIYTCTGVKLEQVDVNSGIVEVEFTGAAVATGTGTGPLYVNSADASFFCSFSPKGSFITEPIRTWRLDNGLRKPNTFKDGRTDTGAVKHHIDQSRVFIWVSRSLYGGWNNPYQLWNVAGTTYSDDLLNEYEQVPVEQIYTKSQSDGMVSSPFIYNITLNLSDYDSQGIPEPGGPIGLSHQVKVYAPRFNPTVISQTLGPWEIGGQSDFPNPVNQGGAGQVQYDYWKAWSEFFGLVANMAVVAGTLSEQVWLEGISTAVGIPINQFTEADGVESVVFNDVFGDTDSIFLDPKTTDMSEWEMVQARKLVKFTKKRGKCEAYSTEGFTGFVEDDFKVETNAKNIGVFNKKGTDVTWYGGGSGGSNTAP